MKREDNATLKVLLKSLYEASDDNMSSMYYLHKHIQEQFNINIFLLMNEDDTKNIVWVQQTVGHCKKTI